MYKRKEKSKDGEREEKVREQNRVERAKVQAVHDTDQPQMQDSGQ